TMPYTMGAFSMAAISIIGIPLSGGFMSKVYVANAAIDSGLWIYAGTILFWTLLTALYFFRIINSAYFDEPDQRTRPHDPRRMNLIPIMTLAVASILIGFLVEIPMDLIRPAAMLLLPGGGI
ncbi:MAG: monovalent cation/H+ antiporter subunit D family protein, partial [Methanocalculus sp. MSAO_Arc1]